MIQKVPHSRSEDVQEIIDNKELGTVKERAEMIYAKIKDFEARSNDSFSKPMPCTIEELVEYLEANDEKA